MRFIKFFVISGLCFLMGACFLWKGEIDIDIGDYENQLEAWNSQDMPDYQIRVKLGYNSNVEVALITVKSGIPVSSNPSYWLEDERNSTIPEFYSFIKREEKEIRDEYESGSSSYSLKVSYNTEYHYPRSITLTIDNDTRNWTITLMPLEEGELDIDIGDYENQLEAWNSRNMLFYQLEIAYDWGYYGFNNTGVLVDFIVKNGIPDVSDAALSLVESKGTIPEIYSFIKEREEIIRKGYNGISRSYLNVQYDTEYHYPVQISSGVGHRFGSYERWEITLTPLGEN